MRAERVRQILLGGLSACAATLMVAPAHVQAAVSGSLVPLAGSEDGQTKGVHADTQRFAAFRDPEDGKFDASTWLLERKGALPVPVIVTEPAVGYGGGLALLFFRRSDDGPDTRTTASWGRKSDFGDTGSAVAKGMGFRYLIARKMGLYAGLDYGWGPEDEAVYVTVGSAWR